MPRVSGYIEQIHFTEGALVNKGDLLVQIDPQPFAAEVARLKADLQSAESALALAETEYNRALKLSSARAISDELLDTRLARKQQTAASVASVKAALHRAQLDLSYTRITAPISGRVSYAQITAGNFVNAGQSQLTSLVSTDKMYAYFDVDEQSYLKYQRLTEAGKRADTRDATANKGILIDEKAIGTDLNNKFVLVVNADNQLEYRAVKLGEKVNGLRIVREGLSANDKIVVNGLQRVMPNIQIEPKLVDMATKEQLAGLRKAQQLLDKTSTSLAAESDSSADQG